MPPIIGGIAYLRVNGRQYLLRGDLNYAPGDRERESKTGMDGIHGFGERVIPPFVEGNLTDTADLTVKDFQNMTDVTVTVELGNRKQFVLSNAWTVNRSEVDADEGQFPVRFEGMKGEEITANV
jgi:hypothetical protein